MEKEKGFTLVELLVVVSVIAILASTVLVNLRGARERAMDTRVIASLGQIRAIAEIIQARTTNYAALCAGGTLTITTLDGLNLLRDDIDANNGGPVGNHAACFAAGSDYCVSSTLNVPGEFWCINSRGRSARTTTSCTVATINAASCGGL